MERRKKEDRADMLEYRRLSEELQRHELAAKVCRDKMAALAKSSTEARLAVVFRRQRVNEAIYATLSLLGVDRSEMKRKTHRHNDSDMYARTCQAAALRSKGYTLSAIADEMQRKHCTVVYYLKNYQRIKENPRYDIDLADFVSNFERIFNEQNV